MFPTRSLPEVLAGALTVTLPEPLTLAQVISAHCALDAALHEHELPPDTSAMAVPPRAGSVSVVGTTDKVHAWDGCVMTTVWPFTVMLPVRATVPLFGCTVNANVVLAVPVAGDVIWIQGTLAVARHSQLAVIWRLLVPPVAAAVMVAVGMLTLQFAAACTI